MPIRRSRTILSLAILLALAAAGRTLAESAAPAPAGSPGAVPAAPAKTAKATFAGGCFWCMEGPFDKVDGVL